MPATAPRTLPSGRVIDLDEEARLSALEDLGVLDTAPEERFDRLTQLARRLFGVDAALVTLVDRDRQWFKATDGIDLTEVPRDLSFCDVTVRQRTRLVVEDLSRDQRFRSNPLVDRPEGLRFYAGEPLRAPGGQVVGTLCLLDGRPRVFTEPERQTLADLASYVQRELGVREEYARAGQVQRALLPRRAPDLAGYDVAGVCTPARSVGGDLYDWHPVQGGLALTVADVMGKGFAGAILMASVRAVLRSTGSQPSAAAALAVAAQALEEDLEETGTFVTLFHGRLRPEDGTLTYADAGHGLSLVVRADGSLDRLDAAGMPLGAWPDGRWEEQTVQLVPGDTLVCVSDGVLDLYDGTLGALEQVAALVRRSRDPQDVVARIGALSRRQELADDVTALVVRRRTTP